MTDPSPETLEALSRDIEAMKSSQVSRQEFDALVSLVRGIAERLDGIAPEREIPAEHLAIMSAVFAATIGKRFRINKVTAVGETSGWTQAGRVNLHALRHVRRG
jgi:hypothetical protein